MISQIDTTTHAVTTFPLAGQPSGLAVTPNGKQPYVAIVHNGAYAYVTNYQDNTVSVIRISPAQ